MRHLNIRRLLAGRLILLSLIAVPTAISVSIGLGAVTSEAVACSNTTLSGSYGLQASGAAVNPNGTHSDLVFVGRTAYDGHGQLTGIERASLEGTVEPVESLSGTYQVRADCTGSETFTFLDTGQVVHADVVVVSQANEVMFLDTDPGTLLTVRAIRQ